jgi:hypothetical protein
MNKLVDLLRERYSGFAFSIERRRIERRRILWELRCYENHRERWRLRGRKLEIEKEIRYLLDTVRDPLSCT